MSSETKALVEAVLGGMSATDALSVSEKASKTLEEAQRPEEVIVGSEKALSRLMDLHAQAKKAKDEELLGDLKDLAQAHIDDLKKLLR
jgi:hypothetical protein